MQMQKQITQSTSQAAGQMWCNVCEHYGNTYLEEVVKGLYIKLCNSHDEVCELLEEQGEILEEKTKLFNENITLKKELYEARKTRAEAYLELEDLRRFKKGVQDRMK